MENDGKVGNFMGNWETEKLNLATEGRSPDIEKKIK